MVGGLRAGPLNPPYDTQFLSLHHPLQPESILLLLLLLFFYKDKVTRYEA